MKRILLWAEQGIGDEIFYAGFLRLLPKGGAVFALSVDHRLMPIFARSFPGIKLIERRLVPTIQDDHFDLQAPIGDLGTLLGVSESGVAEIANAPYLIPNLRRCDRLLEDLPSLREGPVCGLAWRSSGSRFSRQKSVDLKSFGHALRSLPHQFVNLQYGDVEGDLQELGRAASRPILVAPDLDVYNDIDGLLSLISLCDVVITCSNVTAHLAGSIGKRAAVILPFGRGRLWYWHEHDDFSPWYPQLRLCRQQADLDWLTPIDEGCSWILESRGNYDRTS